MNRFSLPITVYLLATLGAVSLVSAGTPDRPTPSALSRTVLNLSTTGDVRTSPAFVAQGANQQASLRTVIQNSSLGPQRYLFTYYPNGLIESQRIQCHKSGVWNDSIRTTWTYTAVGRTKSVYVEQYLQGAFRSLSRLTYEYNDAGDVISYLSEQGSWQLAPYSRTLFTYASPGREQTVTTQDWSGAWTNSWRWSYVWNAAGQRIVSVDEEWAHGQWDTTAMTTSTYTGTSIIEENHRSRYRRDGVWGDSATMVARTDGAFKMYSMEWKEWSKGILIWATRTTNSFDANGWFVRTEDEELLQGVMTPSRRVTFTYDHQGNELKRVQETYGNGTWHPAWQISSTYDGSGNMLTSKADEWAGAAWIPSVGTTLTDGYTGVRITDAVGNTSGFGRFSSLAFEYGVVATGVPGGIAEQPRIWELLQNYPNPFNPTTVIRYGLPIQADVRLAVFDALGQRVAILEEGTRGAGYHEVTFDATNLPSGVYFYRLSAESFTETKRLLLIR